MPSGCRCRRRLLAAALAVFFVPAFASAQDSSPSLRIPTIAASAAAAADWASTYHALTKYHVRETNPLLRPLDSSPPSMITLGAVIDAGLLSTWNVTMGRKHPRVAVAGLWAMAAFRSYLVVHNLKTTRAAQRR